MKARLTTPQLWMVRLLAFGVLFLAAVINTTAFLPTLLVGLSLAGLLITGVAGFFTKRYGAAKFCGWVFLLSLGATVVGGVVSLNRQQGDEEAASQIVTAIERFHKEKGAYPASLEALVPAHLPALPPPKWGQSASPYFYRCQSNEFTLSHPIGFKVHRVYHSNTRTWTTED